MPMTATNADLARRGFAALARGDVEAVTELFAPDAVWHGGELTADACHNRGEILTWIRRALENGAIGELVEDLQHDGNPDHSGEKEGEGAEAEHGAAVSVICAGARTPLDESAAALLRSMVTVGVAPPPT